MRQEFGNATGRLRGQALGKRMGGLLQRLPVQAAHGAAQTAVTSPAGSMRKKIRLGGFGDGHHAGVGDAPLDRDGKKLLDQV